MDQRFNDMPDGSMSSYHFNRGLDLSATSRRVLLIEDDPDQAALVRHWLQQCGHRVVVARTREAAMRAVERSDLDLVVADLELPDGSGLEVVKHAKAVSPDRPTIIVTAKGDMGLAVEALRHRVDDFIAKPLRKRAILDRVTQLLDVSAAGESVLAIGAHPDDVEIGVGGILSRSSIGSPSCWT